MQSSTFVYDIDNEALTVKMIDKNWRIAMMWYLHYGPCFLHG